MLSPLGRGDRLRWERSAFAVTTPILRADVVIGPYNTSRRGDSRIARILKERAVDGTLFCYQNSSSVK